MSTAVTVLIGTLDGAGIDGSVDELVVAAAASRSMLVDAQAPLVARLHDQPADFAATNALQQLYRALARVDRGPPVVPVQSKAKRGRPAHS